jgi:chromosome condensin MukBEF complex kleisin-like MukF subunit
MSQMEDRLNTAITSVQETVASVVDLVGQVLAKLQSAATAEPAIDLTDESATLEGLQTDLQTAAEDMQAALAEAPPVATQLPTEGTTTPEGPQVNPL